MRTIGEIIEGAKRARVTQLTEAELTERLNRLEDMIQRRLLLLPRQCCVEYDYEDDRDEEPLLGDGFSELYQYYLMREIDLHHGETNLYDNDNAAFEEAWEDARHYICVQLRPAYGGMLPNQPSIQTIWRGNTESIQFRHLPLIPTEVEATLTQGGEVVARWDESSDGITLEEDCVTISMTAEQTTALAAGIAKLRLTVRDENEQYSNWPAARLRVKEG